MGDDTGYPADEIAATVESRRSDLEALSREIWEDPEIALEETRSAARLQEPLREAGFEIETGVGDVDTAFIARYGDGDPVVGAMGEYDALPGMSQRAAAEREPVEHGAAGHGCGHNLFGVGSLGGVLAVAEAIDRGDLDGTVVFAGTPAEEGGSAKSFMTRAGAFDDVDAILYWHPGWFTAATKGSCLAVDGFEFTFHGESSHAAAAPEAGRSALDAVQLFNTGVEYLREHVPDPVRIHYRISHGGDATNVVPAEAQVEYTIRAPERDDLEDVTARVKQAAEGAAMMTGVDVEPRRTGGIYGILPNETIGDTIERNMQELGGFEVENEELAAELRETVGDVSNALDAIPEEYREKAETEAMFTEPVPATDAGEVGSYSTDSGDVSRVVPLGKFTVATWPVGTSAHTWQAVAASGSVGMDGMVYAAKTMGATLADLLADDELLAEVKAEFEERGGGEYDSPLPADMTAYDLLDKPRPDASAD